MCGRYTLIPNANALVEFFQLPPELFALLEPRYNIAPTQQILTVREKDKSRHAEFMTWGLIPVWSQDGKPSANMINARSETLTQKPAFRESFRHRRCIIPANGFYEWKTTGKAKQPFYIQPAHEKFFAFAGLWDEWQGEKGDPVKSCTIITTTANSLMEPFHDRMPVILKKADFDNWLGPSENHKQLLKPLDPAEMCASPVSNFVSSARNQGPKCLEPAVEKRPEPTLFDLCLHNFRSTLF